MGAGQRTALLQPQPDAVQVHLDLVRFEGDQAGDTLHLGPRILIGPRAHAGVPDVVVVT